MLFLRHDLFLFNQHATGTLCYGIKAHEHLQTDTEFVKKKISKGCTPEVNNQEKHEKTWCYIHQAGKASLKLDPSERPSTKILQDILNSTLEYPIHYVTIREQHLYKLKKLTLVKILFFSFNYR